MAAAEKGKEMPVRAKARKSTLSISIRSIPEFMKTMINSMPFFTGIIFPGVDPVKAGIPGFFIIL
ncbi:hypothetical protein [uncultured Dialister sp.]|uniref:hypothetical protein n=1 Tax=uncultured Dialister sp. TaxID=278064 RepID=UPI0025CDA8F4|nr:hypothetical protein [uncultured Dialister sp.]